MLKIYFSGFNGITDLNFFPNWRFVLADSLLFGIHIVTKLLTSKMIAGTLVCFKDTVTKLIMNDIF